MKQVNILCLCLFVMALRIFAQPGAIDTQFGTNGWVNYINDDTENGFRHMGIQPDGKIIVFRNGNLGRYNTDGTLDNSFGFGGWRRLDHGLADFVIQADGSILVLASHESMGRIFKHSASNGAIDDTWGINGEVTIALAAVELRYVSITLDTKGRIIVAGRASFGASPVIRAVSVARLNADGSLDEGFNNTGIRNQIYNDFVNRGAIECGVDGNDKIVISVAVGGLDVDDIILKFNTDGKLDLGFGEGDGEIVVTEEIQRLAVDVSGKIMYTTRPRPNALVEVTLVYLNADGSLINSSNMEVGLLGLTALDFQDDGKLVAAGYMAGRLIVMRMNADGSFDQSFTDGDGDIDILPGSNIRPAEIIYYNRRLFIAGFIGIVAGAGESIIAADAFILALDATDKRLKCNNFQAGDLQPTADAGKCYKTINNSRFDPVFIPSTATGTVQYKIMRNGIVVDQGIGSVNGKDFPVGVSQFSYTYTDITSHSCSYTITVFDREAPTARSKNITAQLNAAGNVTVSAADVDNGSSDACGIQSRSLSKTNFDCTNVGANTVTFTVSDASNNTSTATATITIEDKIVPEAKCKNVTIILDATGKANITTADIDNGSSDACGIKSLSLSKTGYDCSNKGINQVTFVATDNNNNTSSCIATVTVVDDLAPVITSVIPDPAFLWPSDRKMKNVTINTTFTDNCPGTTYKITGVTIKQGEFPGDNVNPDWEITGDHTVNLRAEIPRKGVKRIYTVAITCTDAAGNTSTSSADVVVAHNVVSPTSGTTVKVGSTVNLVGEFWDVPDKKHIAKWMIDDKTINGTVSEPSGSYNGRVTGTYKFTTAGVYKIRMNVTDQYGYTTYANTNEHLDAIIVVYDPNGGFAYGGGYFNSPAGALITDPANTGEASYGFTLNYFKNSTYPKGETQFEFKTGSFEFNALNFDYLVISNSMAQFKGIGKIIGGQSGIGFTMTVVDGQLDGTGVDKIRMKIYNRSNGHIIYDNLPGASDAALPTQPVGINSTIVISGTNSGLTRSNTSTGYSEMETTTEAGFTGNLVVTVFPNPSTNNFSIAVQADLKEKIIMHVVDLHGRIIERRNVTTNSRLNFGDSYRPGLYIIRIFQGKLHKELKVIKLPD